MKVVKEEPTKKELNEEYLYRGELVSMYTGVSQPLGLSGLKLLYGINKNKKRLLHIVDEFSRDEVIPASAEFKKFSEENNELFNRLSKKADGTNKLKYTMNHDGQMVEQYDIDQNSPEYLTEKAILNKKYEKALKEREAQLKTYDAFLNEKHDQKFDIFYVPMSEVPKDINDKQYFAISWMIADMSPEQEAEFQTLFNKYLESTI